MKKQLLILSLLLILSKSILGNGVAIVDQISGVYFKLIDSRVQVKVNNQVAIIKALQTFRNTVGDQKKPQYAFPLPEQASATNLRWFFNGEWFEAYIAPGGNGSPGGGGGEVPHPDLTQYLGSTPVKFSIPHFIQPDSLLVVELTYVQLLPYSFGNVDFEYPNDYQLIQSSAIVLQELNFDLLSERTIDSVKSINHPSALISNFSDSANVFFRITEAPADKDYHVQYQLSLDELGLNSFSTFISDSASIADSIAGGYFLFIVEPQTDTNNVIDKVFTLIFDRSGSMGWENKIIQAKNAANYIVNNLNEGDYFNIVDFSYTAESFRPNHVPSSPINRQAALSYIASLQADGGTNIGDAFSVAVPQFSVTTDSTANIIIFLTDGQPTVGITSLDPLLQHIQQAVTLNESRISIFCFGIGTDVNAQLLGLISAQNHGLAEFLGNDEIEARISNFYRKIKNPVLLDPQISVTPNILFDLYPDPLPNLYIGQQMIIAGRYTQPQPTSITFSGSAFNQPVQFSYDFDLADTTNQDFQFLTKVWAKKKIENLTALYYTYNPSSLEAEQLKMEIIWLSVHYGVLSQFTIFTTNVPVELVHLTATVVGSSVQLTWQTATELNNHGFIIERKLGKEGSWNSIGFVKGNGTTTSINDYSFIDDLSSLNFKGTVYYRLRQLDFDGSFEYSMIIEVEINTTLNHYELKQNFPNPFNPSTKINYAIPVDSRVILEIFNSIGEKVAVLHDGNQPAGQYQLEWRANKFPSGIYICRIKAFSTLGNEKFMNSMKMILLK